MNLYSNVRLLENDISLLSSSRPQNGDGDSVQVRRRAAHKVKMHLESAARELSLERYEYFEKELYQRLFNLILGEENSTHDKIGGVLAIRELINTASASTEDKILKISDALSEALRSNTDYALLELVTDALGNFFAKAALVSQLDCIERQLYNALDWLKSPLSHRKFVACSLLRHLAEKSPTVFFAKLKEFFDSIFLDLWDLKERIRLAASSAISACLAVLADRTYHLEWYYLIYNKVHEGLSKSTSSETCHGSLILMSSVLTHTGDFLIPRYRETCRAVLLLKDNKSIKVKSALLQLLPQLSNYCPDIFASSYIDDAIDLLIKCSRVPELRAEALITTGKLCIAIGPRIISRTDEMLDIAREALTQGNWNTRQAIAPEAVLCIADMVLGMCGTYHNTFVGKSVDVTNVHVLQAIKMRSASSINDDLIISEPCISTERYVDFQHKILNLVEAMLLSGLRKELVDALIVLADYLPAQKAFIEERLVDEAIKILGGQSKSSSITAPDFSYSWSKQGTRYGCSKGRGHIALGRGYVSKDELDFGGVIGARKYSIANQIMVSSVPDYKGGGANSPTPKSGNYGNNNGAPEYGGSSSSSSSSNSEKVGNNAAKSSRGLSVLDVLFPRQSSSRDSNSASSIDIEAKISKSPELVILALKIVSSLTPPAYKLIKLLRGSVVPYISSENPHVRREAVITCSVTLASSGALDITTGPSSRAIEEVISRLVEVLISDHVLEIRLSLIRCITSQFDICLSRQHHVDGLSYLLADESFELRIEAIIVLSRLAIINPATVLPHFRFLLARLISELRSTFDDRVKEETILMISSIIRTMSLYQVIRSYMRSIATSLPFGGFDVPLTIASLEAFGEVCLVMKRDCFDRVVQLLPAVINYVRDSATKVRQETALKTLGQMVSASGLVITPYLQFPQLYPFILDLIVKTSDEGSWSTRREALRTIGIIGALEPRRFDKIVSQLIIYSTMNSKISLDQQTEEKTDMTSLSSLQTSKLNSSHPSYKQVSSTQQQMRSPSQASHHPWYGYLAATPTSNNSSLKWKEASDALASQSGDGKDISVDPSLIHSEALVVGENGNLPSHLFMYEQSVMRSLALPSVEEAARLLPNNENFYPHVAISALLKILKDDSISNHHSSAASTIVSILRTLDTKGVAYLDEIVPYLIKMISKSSSGIQESLLRSISDIVSTAQTLILPHLPQIFDIIVHFWNDHLGHILSLAQDIAMVLPLSFEQYIPQLLPLLLSSLSLPSNFIPSMVKTHKNYSLLEPIEESLKCCSALKIVLRPYNHIVIPVLCKVISQLGELGVDFQKCLILAVKTLRYITTSSDGSTAQHISSVVVRLVHTLTGVISDFVRDEVPNTCPVYHECLVTLCSIGRQIGPKFLSFDACIMKIVDGRGLNISYYTQFIEDIRKGALSSYALDVDVDMMEHNDSFDTDMKLLGKMRHGFENTSTKISSSSVQKYTTNQQQLARTWDVSQRTTASDWQEWMRQIKIDFIRESPSPVIRACILLSQSYLPLAHDLFHAAFISCWRELSDVYQASLVHALETAFKSQVVPPDIMQILLNLAEFMERDVEAFSISLSVLADLAQKSRAYAKALHYRELEFIKTPETCFESLITINKKLDRHDAGVGILKCVQKIQKHNHALQQALKADEKWLETLGYWDEALLKYDSRLAANSSDIAAIAGKLKCLEALGRWEEAIQIYNDNDRHFGSDTPESPVNSKGLMNANNGFFNKSIENISNNSNSNAKAIVIGARASWSLCQWNQMDEFVSRIPDTTAEGSLMRAVLAVNNENFTDASTWIENTRKQLDNTIPTLLSESYSRAYGSLIMAQQCSELEEIVEYKKMCVQNILLQKQFTSSHKPYSNSSWNNMANVPSYKSDLLCLSSLASNDHFEGGGGGVKGLDLSRQHLSVEYMNNQISTHKVDLASKWMLRLRGSCGTSSRAAVYLWKYLINTHGIILNGREDIEARLEFATLCRKNKNLALAEKIVTNCENALKKSNTNIAASDISIMVANVSYANLKLLWAKGNRLEALTGIENLIKSSFASNTTQQQQNQSKLHGDFDVHIKCLLKLGQWKLAMVEPGMPVDKATRREVIGIYHRAAQVSNSNYRAWHLWGLANYRAIEEAKESRKESFSKQHGAAAKSSPSGPSSIDALLPLIVNSMKGLLRAISLGTRRATSSITQDLLSVLSLWFRYGHHSGAKAALEEGMASVHVDNWLGVIPQLIARIDHPEPISRMLLHNLLIELSRLHAQALVFPLSVAITSPKADRRAAAEHLMSSLRSHCPVLIDQALLVSKEFVRVAIVWEEMWHETLEEASKLYFGDGNITAMLEILTGLHTALDNATTAYEVNFKNIYGKDLKFAWECIVETKAIMAQEKYVQPVPPVPPTRKDEQEMSPMEKCLHRAWKFYYTTFQNINKKLPTILSLDLSTVSPRLFGLHDLDLGVPGTYHVSGQTIQIRSFSPVVTIIKSKQRPRKIKVLGENGLQFYFLLKGHEDLRQDERVMQLFGLVNALLAYDRRTGVDINALTVERYAVVPLSPTVGLISWVPNCDTMHDLVKEYRDSRRIVLNMEHKIMQQMVTGSQAYDILSHIQKVDVFEYALENAPGDDLAKILWLKSSTSESWLQRRSNYTRSIAVMSMVGYILGLGDRHPSNLMFLRDSGKVLHIDFGDCFEVALHREKYPERIPFRLTRMLVKAMEISGIEGNFRFTCESVMAVLRENSDSLVATLEAFVYDPLISWRLFNPPGKEVKGGKKGVDLEGNNNETKQHADVKKVTSANITDRTAAKTSAQSAQGVGKMSKGPSSSVIRNESVGATSSLSSSSSTSTTSAASASVCATNIAATSNTASSAVIIGKTSTPSGAPSTVVVEVAAVEVATVTGGKPNLMPIVPSALSGGAASGGTGRGRRLETVLECDADDEEDTVSGDGDDVIETSSSSFPLKKWEVKYINNAEKKSKVTTANTNTNTNGDKKPATKATTGQPTTEQPTAMNATTTTITTSSTSSTTTTTVEDESKVEPEVLVAAVAIDIHEQMRSLSESLSNQMTQRESFSYRQESGRSLIAISLSQHLNLSSASADNNMSATDQLGNKPEMSEKALSVIRRITDKLTGMDFHQSSSERKEGGTTTTSTQDKQDRQDKGDRASEGLQGPGQRGYRPSKALDVADQVDRLIAEATASEHLASLYTGWCSFW